MKTILGISGSLRQDSSHQKLIESASKLSPANVQVHIYRGIDQLPFFHPDQDSQNTPQSAVLFRKTVAQSDGLLISSPEYAHGVPGVLKNALDWLVGSPDFEGKPILLVGTGEFAPNQLEETLKTMSAKILRKTILSSSKLRKAFDHAGNLLDLQVEEELRGGLQLFSSNQMTHE